MEQTLSRKQFDLLEVLATARDPMTQRDLEKATRYSLGTINRVAREMNRHVTLTDSLIEGAFGIDQEQFKKMLCDKAAEVASSVDVIVLAQGSMAYAEQAIYEAIQKPVLSSPRFGAAALAQALSVKERKTC